MKIHKVSKYVAVATSAMRGAKNAKKIISKIYKETNLKVQMISGDLEAAYILQLFKNNLNIKNENYLFIDVGGGSTEVNLLTNGKIISSKITSVSFNKQKKLTKEIKKAKILALI